jgi:hypothetical protein
VPPYIAIRRDSRRGTRVGNLCAHTLYHTAHRTVSVHIEIASYLNQCVSSWNPKQCPSINGYFSQSLRRIRILILEIRQYIPVVKILIFLDLVKISSFLDGH